MMFWIGVLINTVFLWTAMLGMLNGYPLAILVGLLGMWIGLSEIGYRADAKTGVRSDYTYNRYL